MAENMDGRERVNRISDFGEFAQDRSGIAIDEQRPIAAPPDTLDQSFDVGLKPDSRRMVEDQRPGIGLHEGSTAGRNHLSRPVDQSRDHATFAITKMFLAEPFENLRDRKPCCGFYFCIGIDEGDVQSIGKATAHGRFPDTHHADENDGELRRMSWTCLRDGRRGHSGGLYIGGVIRAKSSATVFCQRLSNETS